MVHSLLWWKAFTKGVHGINGSFPFYGGKLLRKVFMVPMVLFPSMVEKLLREMFMVRTQFPHHMCSTHTDLT